MANENPEESPGSQTIVDIHELLKVPKTIGMDATGNVRGERKQELRELKIRFADTEGRRNAAGMLIQKMYSWRGYSTGVESAEQVPSRVTLVASSEATTLATISIGFDVHQHLLVDELYGDVVDSFRHRGERLCEFIKFAVDRSVQSKRVLASLFHIAYIYAHLIQGCSRLLIEVTPRHARFYSDMLLFEQIGEEKTNPRVQTQGVLLALPFVLVEEKVAQFGGQPQLAVIEKSLYPYFFSPQEEIGIVGRLRKLG